ncbi:hypothetical protein CHARACLAT_028107, partial [Characodon lateralis]|nr:hypothetical protein [Characodon lateralis]
TTEVEIEETVVIQEVSRVAKPGLGSVTADSPATPPAEQEPRDQTVKVEEEVAAVEEVKPTEPERASSESESEEEAEYHPNVPASISQTEIPEEKEEEAEEMMKKEEEQQVSAPVVPSLPVEVSQPTEEMCQEDESKKEDTYVEENKDDQEEKESGRETEESTDDPMLTPEEAPDGVLLPGETMVTNPTEEQEQPRMNGEASLVEVDPRPQVICCSEPPVVKTEMVTISDTFAAQKTEIATKEVPIVHTETKTITYEAAQLDGSGDGEPGVLMTAQTITSESLCTTTTTHITK